MSNQCKHGQLGRVCEICELTKEVERLRTIFSPIEERARLTFDLATMEVLIADNPTKGADRLAQIIVAWSEADQRAEHAEAEVERLKEQRRFYSDACEKAEAERNEQLKELTAISTVLGTQEGHSSVDHVVALKAKNAILEKGLEKIATSDSSVLLEYFEVGSQMMSTDRIYEEIAEQTLKQAREATDGDL